MKTFRATSLLAALAVALLLLAGCGDDSDSDGGDTQPAADLVAEADEICARNNEERPNPPTIPPDPSAAELRPTVDYFETDLEVTRKTLDELSELTPPEGLEEQWATVLDGFRAVIDVYPQLIDAAEAGDGDAFVRAIGTIQERTKDLLPAADEVGLQVCAAGS